MTQIKDINGYQLDPHSPATKVKDMSEQDYSCIDNILRDSNGDLQLVSAKDVEPIPQHSLSLWCRRNSLYSIVTTELIDWLKEEIGDQKAIEIGAGCNILGKALDIPQTDSYLQNEPEIIANFELMQQPIIQYPKNVLKLEAKEACGQFMPQVVIGSWITQLGSPSTPQSSPYGVNETKILSWVDKYIMIGHEDNHNMKIIMKIPHKVYELPFIYSRSLNTKGNKVWVWDTTGF